MLKFFYLEFAFDNNSNAGINYLIIIPFYSIRID